MCVDDVQDLVNPAKVGKRLTRAAKQVWVKKPDRSGQYRWIPDDGKNDPDLDSE